MVNLAGTLEAMTMGMQLGMLMIIAGLILAAVLFVVIR